MCYYKWKAWCKLLPSSGLKKNICACFYHPHQTNIFLNVVGHAQNIVHQIFCAAVTLKKNELTVNISLKETNWHALQIAKTQFRYTIWFGISEKSITRYTFLHCGGAHMYQKSQQTKHSKKIVCQNFQSFNPWKLPSCLLVIFIDMNTYKGN